MALVASSSCSGPTVRAEPPTPAHAPADTARGERFVVIYRPGPAWRAGRPVTEQDLRDHFFYLKALFDAGRVTLAGPFLDDSGGIVVFRAADRADAERTVAADPAVVRGVMTGQLHPWRAAFEATRPAARAARQR